MHMAKDNGAKWELSGWDGNPTSRLQPYWPFLCPSLSFVGNTKAFCISSRITDHRGTGASAGDGDGAGEKLLSS